MTLPKRSPTASPEKTELEKLRQRAGVLKTERSSWISHWRDINTNLLPRTGRFLETDTSGNRGTKRTNSIFDNTATRAHKILSAGLMSGMTSPARPWFRLTLPDEDLTKHESVKQWLSEVTKLLLRVFAKSNTYLALHTLYNELGAYGTGCSIITDDYDTVLSHVPLTIGEYAMAVDSRGKVDTIYRFVSKTVAQMVEEYGYNNCSRAVRDLYDRSTYDTYFPIIQAIEPRRDRDPRKLDARNKRWKSCHFEPGVTGGPGETKYLRESGFDKFPALTPRWEKIDGDVYGGSPGMEALGDIRQLMHEQLRKANAIDYMSKPAVALPTALAEHGGILPGDILYHDAPASQNAVARNIFDVNLPLDHLLLDIQDVRDRIRGSFYADLFLAISQTDNNRMTATEVAERHEEKLLMLGPVLERLHNELLDPLIDHAFDRLARAGALPPPPEELQGMPLEVEFVSILAQAQRAIGINSVDRFVLSLGQVATMKPEVLDKFDQDRWADVYSDSMGIDPELIVPTDKVALVRQQRAQAAAQAKANEQAQIAADTLAKAGSVPAGAGQGAMDMLNQFTGYGSPTGKGL